MSQSKYTLDLLAETGTMECHPIDTSIEFNAKLRNTSDRIPVDKEKYQSLMRKLIYLYHIRPDISYVMSIVNQFMQIPYEDYIEVVNKIMRYLKTIPGKGLRLRMTNRRCILGLY